MTKIAIIGGGASGLACAVELMHTVKNKEDVSVTVLERLTRVGKKILVTGNGRCNLTNMNSASSGYRGDTDFAAVALNRFTPESNIEFFGSFSIMLFWSEFGICFENTTESIKRCNPSSEKSLL